MPTYQLHINGIVQGVGFRPLVYRLANELDIAGEVSNGRDGVRIRCNTSINKLRLLQKNIRDQLPAVARIVKEQVTEIADQDFDGFKIVESQNTPLTNVKLSPDFGLCEDCKADLNDPGNRRQDYAFTTCATCGPRYSIIDQLPYDRANTAMEEFEMCPKCLREYHDPTNRRHFSQTNSCPTCGIAISLYREKQKLEDLPDLLEVIDASLRNGEIVAVKAIGGYLLLVNAEDPEAVSRLRLKKRRPHKPLAMLFPDTEVLERYAHLSQSEHKAIASSVSPIVLLRAKKHLPGIAPGLDTLGCMLPSAPLLYLISKRFEGPLVATSGNISGSPIVFEDEVAVERLSGFADLVVTNNRTINTPQDDSVMRFAGDQALIIRRSRGLAPGYFGPLPEKLNEGVLALGADLKSSFALIHQGNCYASQYLGNLESYDAQQSFSHTLKHLQQVLSFQPRYVLADLHPGYYGHQLLTDREIPSTTIQHHEAHFAAVLQENDLIHDQSSVLGVIWDGTGYGTDGNMWGGEFFKYDQHKIKRLAHFGYHPVLAGDKMAQQPRLSALSFFGNDPFLYNVVAPKFSPQELSFYDKAAQQAPVGTSSIGRLFDAVASVLNLLDESSFEGQGAMRLEESAAQYKGQTPDSYPSFFDGTQIDIAPLAAGLASDIIDGLPAAAIAFRFHITLVKIIEDLADYYQMKEIAFSGGVFQNALLVQLINKELGNTHHLYFHRELSPNDENIAFGQLAHYHMQQTRRTSVQQNQEDYVLSNSR